MRKKIISVFVSLVALLALVMTNVSAAPPGTWITDVTVFNTDSVNGATVVLTRYNAYTSGPADNGTTIISSPIAAGGSFYYNPLGDANFPTNFNGSIVLSSDKPLAAIVGVANSFSGRAYASDTYGGISKVSTKVILPIVMARLGTWNTRVSIQNAGSAPTDVTITYAGANAPAPQLIAGVPPGQAVRVDQYDAGVTNFNGSATVTTSGQPVAVTVEEYRTTGGVLITYNGALDTDADNTIYMPGYIDLQTWTTDFTIVNTDPSVAASVKITFSDSPAQITGTIPANGTGYFNAKIIPQYPAGFTGTFPSSYYGSATITSTGGKIVAEYNIANNGPGGPGNMNEGYVGLPSASAALTVFDSLIENAAGTGWTTTFTVQNVEGGTANLKLYYGGNLAPLCNPCLYTMTTGAHNFNQSFDGHLPKSFLGGVRIVSDKKIVVIGDQSNQVFPMYAPGDSAGGFTGIAGP